MNTLNSLSSARVNNFSAPVVLGALVAVGATLYVPAAQAQTQIGEHFTLSGFGTLGAVNADTERDSFVRNRQSKGAKDGVSLKVDSNLGLQLTGRASSWLSATVQGVYMQREQENAKLEPEWAFVKVTPLEGLALRAGRFSLPMFLVSDSRNVGYANNWARPPDEVYALALLNRLDGADVSYRLPLGSTALTVTAFVGDSDFALGALRKAKVNKVQGFNFQWDADWLQLRVGQVKAKVPEFSNDSYTFTGVGATVERDDIFAQAEYVTRRSAGFPANTNAEGWYVMGGYRFGNFLPFVTFAETTSQASTFQTSGAQQTRGVGLRWDAFSSAALKFQAQRTDPQGTVGISFTPRIVPVRTPGAPGGFIITRAPAQKATTVFSAAIDFVF